jgi:hypothetical protein
MSKTGNPFLSISVDDFVPKQEETTTISSQDIPF